MPLPVDTGMIPLPSESPTQFVSLWFAIAQLEYYYDSNHFFKTVVCFQKLRCKFYNSTFCLLPNADYGAIEMFGYNQFYVI